MFWIHSDLSHKRTAKTGELSLFLARLKGLRINITCVENEHGEVLQGQNAANYINQYYVEVGEKLARKFKTLWGPNQFFTELCKVKFSFVFVTEKSVKEILKHLPLNKSSCVELLSSHVIRDSLLEMITVITHLINECLTYGLIPDKWKIGYVTPLPKGKCTKKPSGLEASISVRYHQS